MLSSSSLRNWVRSGSHAACLCVALVCKESRVLGEMCGCQGLVGLCYEAQSELSLRLTDPPLGQVSSLRATLFKKGLYLGLTSWVLFIMADMPHISAPWSCWRLCPARPPKIGFYCVALAGFELTEINSPLLPKCWD